MYICTVINVLYKYLSRKVEGYALWSLGNPEISHPLKVICELVKTNNTQLATDNTKKEGAKS